MIAQSSSLGGRPEVWVLAHMLRRVIVVVSESVSLCFATPQQFTSRPQTIEKPKAEGGGGGGGGGGVHLESYTREARRRRRRRIISSSSSSSGRCSCFV